MPEPQRPRTRADCEQGPRPCPWVGCRHHTILEVQAGGALTTSVPAIPTLPLESGSRMVGLFIDDVVEALTWAADTCSLDVADRQHEQGEVLTQAELALALGLGRSGARDALVSAVVAAQQTTSEEP